MEMTKTTVPNMVGEFAPATETPTGLLGYNVWWSVKETRLPVSTVHAALVANGFNPDNDFPVTTDFGAFCKTMASFSKSRLQRRARKISEDSGAAVWGIEFLGVDQAAQEVWAKQTTKATFLKQTGTMQVEGKLADEVTGEYNALRTMVTDEDMRAFLTSVAHNVRAIAKRPSGGIYFAPVAAEATLRAAQKVVAATGFGKLYVERVFGGPEEVANIWDAVEADITSTLTTTMEIVDKINSKAGCLPKHLAALGDVEAMVDLYAGVLGKAEAVERLQSLVSTVADQISSKMLAIQASKEAAKAAKANGTTETPAVEEGAPAIAA